MSRKVYKVQTNLSGMLKERYIAVVCNLCIC